MRGSSLAMFASILFGFGTNHKTISAVGTIEGTIRDQAGAPIASATVTITGTTHAVRADRAGRYRLPNLTAGT